MAPFQHYCVLDLSTGTKSRQLSMEKSNILTSAGALGYAEPT